MRVKLSAALLASAAITALAASPVAAARPSSGYQQPVVNWVQPTVVSHDGTAIVHIQYTCWGGSAGTHVYIGVKQGADVNATDHTSSQFADTFYSTNWNADGPGNALTCDGTKQNQRFTLEPDPFFAFGHPTAPALSPGMAFVQVCVFDSTNQGGDDMNGFAFDYSMRKVVTN